jgi:hypothetical protein
VFDVGDFDEAAYDLLPGTAVAASYLTDFNGQLVVSGYDHDPDNGHRSSLHLLAVGLVLRARLELQAATSRLHFVHGLILPALLSGRGIP